MQSNRLVESMVMAMTASDIREAVDLFHEPGELLELRAFGKRKGDTRAGYFKDIDQFVKAAVELDQDPGIKGVYVVANVIKDELYNRSQEKVQPSTEQPELTKDVNILRRRWLLLDFDPVRPDSDSASTKAEHEAAVAKAGEVKGFLTDMGWPDPIVGDSGNGAHLDYRIDLPNDTKSRILVENCLKAIDQIFSDEKVHGDIKNGNAARIWKLYGSTVRKGKNTEDRPWRRSAILQVPEHLEVVTKSQLEALAAMYRGNKKAKGSTGTGTVSGSRFKVKIEAEKWLAEHGISVARTKKGNDGSTIYILSTCPWNIAHTDHSAFIVQFQDGGITAKCHHDGCSGNDWKSLRALYGESANDDNPPELEEVCTYNDSGKPVLSPTKAAKAVIDKLTLAMAEDQEDIYQFDGQVYTPTGDRAIDKMLCDIAGDMVTGYRLKETIRRVKNDLQDKPVRFEPDPYLLGVDNGVVNLLTGEFRSEYRPDDYLLDKISVKYDPAARCPVFLGYLESSAPNVSDRITLIDWFAALGIRLPFPYVLFLLGLGRNGKGLYERLVKAFYGRAAFRDMELTEIGHSNFARAAFYRSRGWVASETGRGKIGTDFIKMVSGAGVIDSDRKNTTRIQFEPYFKTIVDTNVMPRVEDRSRGWMERFVKVDLPYVFVESPDPNNPLEKQKKPELFDELTSPEELSGILNLIISRSQIIGKTLTITRRPAKEMFAEYTVQSSSLLEFAEQFLIFDDTADYEESISYIYDKYREWCSYLVGEVVDIRYFGRLLSAFCNNRPSRQTKDRNTKKFYRYYRGLKLDTDRLQQAINELKVKKGIVNDCHQLSTSCQEEIGQQIAKLSIESSILWINILRDYGQPDSSSPSASSHTRRDETCKFVDSIDLLTTSIASAPNKSNSNDNLLTTLLTIISPNGYRERDNNNIDHTYRPGETVEFPHDKAMDLIAKGIAAEVQA